MCIPRKNILPAAASIVSLLISPALLAESKTVATGDSWVIPMDVDLEQLTIEPGGEIRSPGRLVTLIADGVEVDLEPGVYENVQLRLSKRLENSPVPGNSRGLEDYRPSLLIGADGVDRDVSIEETITGGAYDDDSASGISVRSTSDTLNGVMLIDGAHYRLEDATFDFRSDEDGSRANDFVGYGAVVSAFGDSTLEIDNADIHAEGVVRMALFVTGGSDVLMQDSRFTVMGGELYDGYVNSANFVSMTAPPWVLGIKGSARGTNLMGRDSTTTIVRTEANAANWGVVSTDVGSAMTLTVVDSTLNLIGEKNVFAKNHGAGYGTYILGGQEYFYGTTFNVGTYAGIITNGSAWYGSSNFDKPLDIYPQVSTPTGETTVNAMGRESMVYETRLADTPVFTGIEGMGRPTVINSDTFGWMAHAPGKVVLSEGTIVNTGYTTFVLKAGSVDLVVEDGTQLNAGNGVILQIMDNDDRLVGLHANSPIRTHFRTTYSEPVGYPGIDYEVESYTSEGAESYSFTATDVDLEGDIYNASGYYGGQPGDVLTVTLGHNTSLTGAISTSSWVHADENGQQKAEFSIDEYYYISHVSNRLHYNGVSKLGVTLEDGASWTVTGPGTLTSLTIEEGARISGAGEAELEMRVDGRETAIAPGTYEGVIELSLN